MTIEYLDLIANDVLTQLSSENINIFAKDQINRELIHAKDVLKWLLVINPNSSFEVQTAALLHDCERIIDRGDKTVSYKGDRKSQDYIEHKKQHALRSSELAKEMLNQRSISTNQQERIYWLILHHDDTGENLRALKDDELDNLVSADSFSFFTSIARNMLDREGKDRVKDKSTFMMNKIPKRLLEVLQIFQIEDVEIEQIKNEVISKFFNK